MSGSIRIHNGKRGTSIRATGKAAHALFLAMAASVGTPVDAAAEPAAVPAEPEGKAHPFFAGEHDGQAYYHLAAEDRIQAVKGFNVVQCLAVLRLAGLQKTVAVAAERRIRQLEGGQ